MDLPHQDKHSGSEGRQLSLANAPLAFRDPSNWPRQAPVPAA